MIVSARRLLSFVERQRFITSFEQSQLKIHWLFGEIFRLDLASIGITSRSNSCRLWSDMSRHSGAAINMHGKTTIPVLLSWSLVAPTNQFKLRWAIAPPPLVFHGPLQRAERDDNARTRIPPAERFERPAAASLL
jgi:hypothetical protein